MDCFFIEQNSIELKPHETTHFEVQYIATTAKRREALLVFMNEAVGEFLFLIEGVPKKPEYVRLTINAVMTHVCRRISAGCFPYRVRKQLRSTRRKEVRRMS